MIVLHQSKPGYGLPSVSPFSLKLELFLRAAGIDYSVSHAMRNTPKRKAPFVLYNGEYIGDSQLIMERLTKDLLVILDQGLSEEQKSQGYLICRALEEGYYFCGMYANWQQDRNWAAYRDVLLADLPRWIRIPGAGFFRRRMIKALYLQGIGRHSYEEVQHFGVQYLQALETLIGAGPYLFGDMFTTYDCTVYGFLARGLRVQNDSSMHRFITSSGVLRAYCRRIDSAYEMAEPL
jgi:glutathione S-transferase